MSPCTRSLISLAGVTLGKRRAAAKRREVKVKEKKHKHMMVSTAACIHTFLSPSSTQVYLVVSCAVAVPISAGNYNSFGA